MTERKLPEVVAIAGATGLLGGALAAELRGRGCRVVPISRRPAEGGILWNPARGELPAEPLEGIGAVINLSGESIASGRWTTSRKQALRSSRLDSTSLLATTLASLRQPPEVFVSASAVGIYGDHGNLEITEDTPSADDFLGRLGAEWEAAAEPAATSGIRVVHPRTALVMAGNGGALSKLEPLFRLGLGGRLGSGRQWFPWIALSDWVSAVIFLIERNDLAGPFNLAAPVTVTNGEFTRTLAQVLHRPALIPVPAPLLRLVLGEMAEATLLVSQRAVPERLEAAGFRFQHPELEGALRAELRSASR